MDHGVINSQSHMMVCTKYVLSTIVLLAVYNAVNFNATLTPSGILVTWQVS